MRQVKQQVKLSQVHGKWKQNLKIYVFWPCCWGLRHWKKQQIYFYENFFENFYENFENALSVWSKNLFSKQ